MAKSVANVNISEATFGGWLEKTNQLCYALTNQIVSTETSTSGANVSGKSSIIGTLAVSNLAVTLLRGGTAGNTANVSTITIGISGATSSNVTVSGNRANIVANTLGVTSNTIFTGANISITTANVALGGGALNVTSNTNTTGANVAISSNLTFTGANAHFGGAKITANDAVFTSDVNVGNNLVFNSNSAAIAVSNAYFLYPGTGSASNVVASFTIADFKSAKFNVSAKNNANTSQILFTEISTVFDSVTSNAYYSEYGTIYSDARFLSFTVDANTTHVRLNGTANSSVTNAIVTVITTKIK